MSYYWSDQLKFQWNTHLFLLRQTDGRTGEYSKLFAPNKKLFPCKNFQSLQNHILTVWMQTWLGYLGNQMWQIYNFYKNSCCCNHLSCQNSAGKYNFSLNGWTNFQIYGWESMILLKNCSLKWPKFKTFLSRFERE